MAMTKIDGNTIVSTKGTIKSAENNRRLLATPRKSFLMIAYIAVFISSILLPSGSQGKINIFQTAFYEIYRIDILAGFYNLSHQTRNFFFIVYFGFKCIGATFDKIQLLRNG